MAVFVPGSVKVYSIYVLCLLTGFNELIEEYLMYLINREEPLNNSACKCFTSLHLTIDKLTTFTLWSTLLCPSR